MRITVTMKPKKSKVIGRLTQKMVPNLKRGLLAAGIMIETKVVKLLSGPSHVRNPGVSNPYPGVLTNRLRASVNVQKMDGGMTVVIGPNTVYARALEYGHPNWPAGVKYPYMAPAWEQEGKKAIDRLQRELMRGI
jgi:hypothetical protein